MTRTQRCTVHAGLILIAAAGASAPADVFTWTGAQGNWSDPLRWNGPAQAYPNSIVDSATVSGNAAHATLDTNVSLGLMSILGGGYVQSNGHSIFVNGDIQLIGANSTLTVTPTPALRDLDVDTLNIQSGILSIYGGLAQFDESLVIGSTGGIIGLGTLEMNSTTGDLVLNSGLIWAAGGSSENDHLMTIQRTPSSTSRLDWTHAGSNIDVWDANTLDVRIPFAGSLGGELWVATASTFKCDSTIIASSMSNLRLTGGDLVSNVPARIEAPAIDAYGSLSVSGNATIIAPIIKLRGTGALSYNARLVLDSTVVILDSFDADPVEGDGASVRFGLNAGTLSITGGETSISSGAGGTFDLDGPGSMIVNIAADSSLALGVEFLEGASSSTFDGTLNIDGSLHIDPFGDPALNTWTNAGEINLDSGQITGRKLRNTGSIAGHGSIDATLLNDGELIAGGGTLFLSLTDYDGVQSPQIGSLSAVSGDIVSMLPASNAASHFSGSMLIGNGAGIREVIEMNNPFEFITQDGATGSLSLNSGFFRAKSVKLDGSLETMGASLIRASGADQTDMIEFAPQGASTISGTLDLDGEARIRSGAVFSGEGALRAVSPIRRIDLAHGAALSDVSLEASGALSVNDQAQGGVGSAQLAGLTLTSTSSLQIDLAGSEGELDQDRITAWGAVQLAGELRLRVNQGFAPQIGRTYTIITSPSVTGAFEAIDDSTLEDFYRLFVRIYSDRVDVFVTCIADVTGDGSINFFDVSAFLSAFDANDESADINHDGVFNFFDVSAFLNTYSMGC